MVKFVKSAAWFVLVTLILLSPVFDFWAMWSSDESLGWWFFPFVLTDILVTSAIFSAVCEARKSSRLEEAARK